MNFVRLNQKKVTFICSHFVLGVMAHLEVLKFWFNVPSTERYCDY